jgi:hypothetical protein
MLATLLFLAAAASARGGEQLAIWQPGWNVDLHRNWCGLNRYYLIPNDYDREKGVLKGTAYSGMIMTFRVNTRSLGDAIPEDQLDRLQFWLTLSIDSRDRSGDNEFIRVLFNGFEARRTETGPAHLFMFEEEDARAIFDQFKDEKRAAFTFHMANGETRESLLFPTPTGYFTVYAAMLQTCVNENRD